jgi:hypothetical protein
VPEPAFASFNASCGPTDGFAMAVVVKGGGINVTQVNEVLATSLAPAGTGGGLELAREALSGAVVLRMVSSQPPYESFNHSTGA